MLRPRAERTLHSSHVVERAESRHQPAHLGGVGRVGQRGGGLDDDVRRVTCLSGKAGYQQVLSLLGRGVPAREVVVEGAADRRRQPDDGDGADHPDQQDPPAAVVAPPRQPAQPRGLRRLSIHG